MNFVWYKVWEEIDERLGAILHVFRVNRIDGTDGEKSTLGAAKSYVEQRFDHPTRGMMLLPLSQWPICRAGLAFQLSLRPRLCPDVYRVSMTLK